MTLPGRHSFLALLELGTVLALPGRALGEDAHKEPYEFIRSLQVVQDEIARGSSAAHSSQRKLLSQIGEQLRKVGSDVWKEPRNARAALVFVLSGGDPTIVRDLLGRGVSFGVDEKLVKGALAYAEGRDQEAAQLLGSIDARSLEPTLGAQVALVQSVVMAKKDAKKAIAHLDVARLLAPGTLVEEAALRREVFLVAGMGDHERFEQLSSQYLRRFRNSIYGASFRRQFAAEVSGELYANTPARLANLEPALQMLDSRERRDVYLSIAREAIIGGRVEVARFAAKNATPLTDEGSLDNTRCKIYEAAALIVTDEFERGISTLSGIERGKLDATDAELLDAALTVAHEVRRPPVLGDATTIPKLPPEGKPDQGDRNGVQASFNVLNFARQVIAKVDELLSRVAR